MPACSRHSRASDDALMKIDCGLPTAERHPIDMKVSRFDSLKNNEAVRETGIGGNIRIGHASLPLISMEVPISHRSKSSIDLKKNLSDRSLLYALRSYRKTCATTVISVTFLNY